MLNAIRRAQRTSLSNAINHILFFFFSHHTFFNFAFLSFFFGKQNFFFRNEQKFPSRCQNGDHQPSPGLLFHVPATKFLANQFPAEKRKKEKSRKKIPRKWFDFSDGGQKERKISFFL